MAFDYSRVLGKMKEKNLTQAVVARRLGISENSFRNKIKGRTDFTTGEIFALALLLDVTQDIGEYFFCVKK